MKIHIDLHKTLVICFWHHPRECCNDSSSSLHAISKLVQGRRGWLVGWLVGWSIGRSIRSFSVRALRRPIPNLAFEKAEENQSYRDHFFWWDDWQLNFGHFHHCRQLIERKRYLLSEAINLIANLANRRLPQPYLSSFFLPLIRPTLRGSSHHHHHHHHHHYNSTLSFSFSPTQIMGYDHKSLRQPASQPDTICG